MGRFWPEGSRFDRFFQGFPIPELERNVWVTVLMAAIARSMSSLLVWRPRLRRRKASASLRLRPKASRTWDGVPRLQAEPLLQVTRRRSS